MHNIWVIAKREYKLFFTSPVAYVGAFFMFIVIGLLFYGSLSAASEPTMGYVPSVDVILYPLGVMVMLFTPALTTRLLAGEQRAGTIELLLTAPVRDWELVVGKWLGAVMLMMTIVATTLVYPAVLNHYVKPGIDQGPLISGYLGVTLLCFSLIALGVFISSLFSSQIATFLATLGLFIFLWWIIGPLAQIATPSSTSYEVLRYLDFSGHYYDNFVTGVLDLRDITFYLSLTALGLFLSSVVVEMRRWR